MGALQVSWELLKEMVPLRARASSSGRGGWDYGDKELHERHLQQVGSTHPWAPGWWQQQEAAKEKANAGPTLQSIDVRPGQVCPHCGRGGQV